MSAGADASDYASSRSNREVMPSHFKVKEYCPLVFRAFREYWKVHDGCFRVSVSAADDTIHAVLVGFVDGTTDTVERND